MQNQRGNHGWRDVLIHQREVVYRCNCVKEDVLFRYRNTLHQLQTVLFATGDWFVHSCVYIPPQAHVSLALQNKANLYHELPKYRQHIKCPTRDSNILDIVSQWITSFLTDRQQLVRLGKFSSSTHGISTGAPQGCVLSPLIFFLYI